MREIHEKVALEEALREGSLERVVLQNLDLRPHMDRLREIPVNEAVLLGCKVLPEELVDLVGRGALVFPKLPELPFNPYRSELYSADELFEAFDPAEPCTYCDCSDARIYRHWRDTGRAAPASILETLARRLHDHAVSDALEELLEGQKVVAFMGGHSLARGDASYLAVARMSAELARRGYLMASGGGPGAMEATHLGVWFAERSDDELLAAIEHLATAPKYDHERWLAAAMEVRAKYPNPSPRPSLGVPTWFYGHEPPNAFASHIAKYFANSVREEGLVSIATHGIIFAPGKAGTVQEIFQDAAQNHYGTVDGLISPMVLFDVKYWTEKYPVLPLLRALSAGRPYQKQITIEDDPEKVVSFIVDNPPIEVKSGWSYCDHFCSE